MLVLSKDNIELLQEGTAVTIGNFDGGHLGHQALGHKTLALANEMQLKSLALTFYPRPADFFHTSKPPQVLFSRGQKRRFFAELGFAAYHEQTFDLAFSQLSAQAFYQSFLREYLKAKVIVVGENFYFGHKREGTVSTLREFTKQDGVKLVIVPGQKNADDWISSTRIRQTLINPLTFNQASDLLGRPYLIEGKVQKGRGIGRTLKTPTANLKPELQMLPACGVYAAMVHICPAQEGDSQILKMDSRAKPAVVNIGFAPTIKPRRDEICLEAHLLTQENLGDLYDRVLGVYLVRYLRPERKYSSTQFLQEQIKKDIKSAEQILQFAH